jgi:hypothetical protein
MKHVILCLLAGALLYAQQPAGPPKLLRIYREDIKEGKGAAHAKVEMRWAQTLARLKYPANLIGMISMTGNTQAWSLEGHESFADIGNTDAFYINPANRPVIDAMEAQDAEFRSSSRTLIAVFRSDLSYGATQLMQDVSKGPPFMNVVILRIHPGRDREFTELAKAAVAESQKAANDQPIGVYEVVSGAPNGMFLVFEPFASMKSLDDAPKRFIKHGGETLESEESILFAINPKMSYVVKPAKK